MKEDFLRLLSAAMEYHPTRVRSPADLARFLNESDQTIHNWSKRGLPKTKVFDLAMAVGCNGVWLRDGTGPKSAASLKTVMEAIAETTYKPEMTDQGISHQASDSLINEIAGREIPPHIEQAMMALLQTCPPAKPKQHTPVFTDEQQQKFFDEMRAGLPEDRRDNFDDFVEYVRSGGKHRFISKGGGFISGRDQKKSDDDQNHSDGQHRSGDHGEPKKSAL